MLQSRHFLKKPYTIAIFHGYLEKFSCTNSDILNGSKISKIMPTIILIHCEWLYDYIIRFLERT